MRYALLIHVDEHLYGQEGNDALLAGYGAFNERYKEKILDGDALQEVATATTVRVRNGKTLMTDGPFAETKEQLGGYYLIRCDNLDEAVEIASHIPDAVRGSIEVRPITESERA